MSVWLADEAATLRAGAALGQALTACARRAAPGRAQSVMDASIELAPSGLHVHLLGGLGAGKTTLARGLLRAMGVAGAVKSPTYTLVEPYQTTHWDVFHFDLYRLNDAEELELLGARDYFRSGALCLVEWPSKGASALPAPSLIVSLHVEKDGRRLHFESRDAPGKVLEEGLNARLKS